MQHDKEIEDKDELIKATQKENKVCIVFFVVTTIINV